MYRNAVRITVKWITGRVQNNSVQARGGQKMVDQFISRVQIDGLAKSDEIRHKQRYQLNFHRSGPVRKE